jgi:hypothetical protein
MFDSYLSDLHTCLKLVPLAMFRSLNLTAPGFGLDTELTALLLRIGIRPFEVPVSYYSRTHAQGKKISWRDAVSCARILIRVRMRQRSRLMLAPRIASTPSELAGSAPVAGEQPVLGLKQTATFMMQGDADGAGARVGELSLRSQVNGARRSMGS